MSRGDGREELREWGDSIHPAGFTGPSTQVPSGPGCPVLG